MKKILIIIIPLSLIFGCKNNEIGEMRAVNHAKIEPNSQITGASIAIAEIPDEIVENIFNNYEKAVILDAAQKEDGRISVLINSENNKKIALSFDKFN